MSWIHMHSGDKHTRYERLARTICILTAQHLTLARFTPVDYPYRGTLHATAIPTLYPVFP